MTSSDRRGPAPRDPHDDSHLPPPVGGSWRRLYAVVIFWLAVQIGLFYLFTRTFS